MIYLAQFVNRDERRILRQVQQLASILSELDVLLSFAKWLKNETT